MDKIKVVIADDHSVVTEGVNAILKSDSRFKVCGIFAEANSLLSYLEKEGMDIIVLDIDMPGSENFNLLKTIKEKHPSCKVVIFTMHEGMYYFFEAMKCGADSYLLKSESITFLPTVLLLALKGNFYCSKELKVHLAKDRKEFKLKPIEHEILEYMAQGFHYHEIAEKVNKSEKSIEYYVYKLRKKHNVGSNSELLLQLKGNLTK